MLGTEVGEAIAKKHAQNEEPPTKILPFPHGLSGQGRASDASAAFLGDSWIGGNKPTFEQFLLVVFDFLQVDECLSNKHLGSKKDMWHGW